MGVRFVGAMGVDTLAFARTFIWGRMVNNAIKTQNHNYSL
jgi:hypothetical protein